MPLRAFTIALLASALASPVMAADEDAEIASSLARMVRGESAIEGAELEAALAEAAQHPLGSEANPVRASMPPGQRAYLARLRCPDGMAPAYERQGSGGEGPYGNIIDYYQVTCRSEEPSTVVMDMYHAGYAEDRPVPGFAIVAR